MVRILDITGNLIVICEEVTLSSLNKQLNWYYLNDSLKNLDIRFLDLRRIDKMFKIMEIVIFSIPLNILFRYSGFCKLQF